MNDAERVWKGEGLSAIYLRGVEVAAGAGGSFCLGKGHAASGGEDRRADLAAITTTVSRTINNTWWLGQDVC